MSPALVLALASTARAEILEQAGIWAVVDPSELDEAVLPNICRSDGLSVEGYALRLSEAEALSVSA